MTAFVSSASGRMEHTHGCSRRALGNRPSGKPQTMYNVVYWLVSVCDVRIDIGINLWERFTFRLTAIDSSDCPWLAASIPSQQGGYSRGELYFSHGC